MKQKLNDESLMPWGIHKGRKMINVPASYLLYMYENNKCCKETQEYIKENIDVLKKQQKEEINENYSKLRKSIEN